MQDLCIQFQKNVNENNDTVKLTGKQLDGMPESVLKQLKTETVVRIIYFYVKLP